MVCNLPFGTIPLFNISSSNSTVSPGANDQVINTSLARKATIFLIFNWFKSIIRYVVCIQLETQLRSCSINQDVLYNEICRNHRSSLCLGLHANGPAGYGSVAAASGWHEFLQANCGVQVCFSLKSYRVGKNHDTKRETPAAAGAARTAGHNTVLFSQKILAAQKAMTYTALLGIVAED